MGVGDYSLYLALYKKFPGIKQGKNLFDARLYGFLRYDSKSTIHKRKLDKLDLL